MEGLLRNAVKDINVCVVADGLANIDALMWVGDEKCATAIFEERGRGLRCAMAISISFDDG